MNIKSVLKSSLLGVIISAILIMITACTAYFTNVSEGIITAAVYISLILGILTGTFIVSKAAENKILLHAAAVCVIYMLFLMLASVIFCGGIRFNARFFIILSGVFLSGLLGCFIGK